MIELPRGIWRWIADNGRDMARVARALEKIAEEIARIRAAMEDEEKEDRE
jgi:hypothetical protein